MQATNTNAARRFLQRSTLALTAMLLAQEPCVARPSHARAQEPPQDSLAAIIREIRVGATTAGQLDVVTAAARIAPDRLEPELKDAMVRLLALTIQAGDSALGEIGTILEGALAAAHSQSDLAAIMRGIPAQVGQPTARQTVAGRLVARLEAGEPGADLLGAMAEAFTSIWQDHYPMHPIRDEVTVAWASHHSAEELGGFIRSITTGAERPEQAAAAIVLDFGPHWEEPPAGVDSTGATHPEVRAALVEALTYLNQAETRRELERRRAEALGDRAALDSLQAGERRRREAGYGRHNLPAALARAVARLGDPATVKLLAEVRGFAYLSVAPFGEAAVLPVIEVLMDPITDQRRTTRLIRDLARIVGREELSRESREAAAAAIQGFLSGETQRVMQITDSYGEILRHATDAAVALNDPVSQRSLRRLASDPAEVIRAGVSPEYAEGFVVDLRDKVDWMPEPRPQSQLANELRTIPASRRESLFQIEAARLASQIDPAQLADDLRAAMVEAWGHARQTGRRDGWYRVRTELRKGLLATYTPATAAAAIRTVAANEYGPEQLLAVDYAASLREDANDDLRRATLAALEYVNAIPVDDSSRSWSPVASIQRGLFYAVAGFLDPNTLPALVRSGMGLVCNSHLIGSFPVRSAREVLDAISEPGASAWVIRAGLDDLASLQIANQHTGELPEDVVTAMAATARGVLSGNALEPFRTSNPDLRFGVVDGAILLAAALNDPKLVALVEALAADPAVLAALGIADDHIESMRTRARERLSARPIGMLGDC